MNKNAVRDQLTNGNVKGTTKAAMRALNAMQDLPAHEQLGGLCLAFMMMAKVLAIPVQDVFTITTNITTAAVAEGRPEVKGFQAYFRATFNRAKS